MTTTKTSPPTSFQSIILTLQHYWAEQGCVILQPYDMEMGAGTFHPATTLRALGPDHHWRAAYVQPSRRPVDGRYGENPNRLQHYYQFQVILKPSPVDSQALYLGSLKAIGLDPAGHDIRFVEDDWESPTLGAAGLGWEVWCDGMEISQFTYFQQVGGIECDPVPVELTYGLERLVMFIQGVDNVYELDWDGVPKDKGGKTYGDIFKQAEREFSCYNFEDADTAVLKKHFEDAEAECKQLLEGRQPLPLPAYDQCIKASHLFNLLDARGVISVAERQGYIGRVRGLAKRCCEAWRDTAGSKPRYYPVPTPAVVKPSEIPPGVRPMKGAVMPELFIEIFSEEIPARMQAAAEDQLCQALKHRLWLMDMTKEMDITEEIDSSAVGGSTLESQSWSGPRRLAVAIRGVAERQADSVEERRGPRADAPQRAVEGFLKSAGISRKQAEVRTTPKGDFLFAVMKHKGRDAAEVLPDMVSRIIGDFKWPKAMRWGAGRKGWIRPLHRVAVLFDGKPLKGSVDFGGGVQIEFDQHTEGHRVLFPVKKKGKKGGLVNLTGGERYEDALETAHVIASRGRRREMIADALKRLAAAHSIVSIEDESLMEEVIGLVEYPHVIMGRIDAEFMDLPPEILTASMRGHQKYFSFEDMSFSLAPFFATVANMVADERRDATIRAGNERVLRARLADARFFWKQDLVMSLDSMVEQLSGVVFFEGLGSMGDKAKRMRELAEYIASRFGSSYNESAESAEFVESARRAGELAKADLVSRTVAEFPELQGVIGGYLARDGRKLDRMPMQMVTEYGKSNSISMAIAEHYRPQGPRDAIPKTALGRVIALADKIDTLVGFFRIEVMPTGSKDPFALRRAALGVIRIIVEGEMTLPLHDILTHAAKIHDYKATEAAHSRFFKPTDEVTKILMSFLYDRFKVWLLDCGFRHDLVTAVTRGRDGKELLRLFHLVEELASLFETDDGKAFLVSYRRAANILIAEEQKDGCQFGGSVDEGLFTHETERNLYQHIAKWSPPSLIPDPLSSMHKWFTGDTTLMMQPLADLRKPIDAFFESVKVNDPDPAIRQNRLNLLAMIRNAMHEIADFSAIEGHSDRPD